MLVQWWGYHDVVKTLKPYLTQKNLCELFTLTLTSHYKILICLEKHLWDVTDHPEQVDRKQKSFSA